MIGGDDGKEPLLPAGGASGDPGGDVRPTRWAGLGGPAQKRTWPTVDKKIWYERSELVFYHWARPVVWNINKMTHKELL